MALVSSIYGQDVIVVPSSDATPYVKAQEAIKDYVLDRGNSTTVVALDDIGSNLDNVIGGETKAVVAIGSKAAVQLKKQVKAPVLLTYCMVAGPAKLGLEKAPSIPGISTDVPLESQFSLIAEALPKVRTVGMFYNAQTKEGKSLLKKVQASLPGGWQLKAVAVDDKQAYNSTSEAIDALFESHIDIVWTQPDSSIYTRATVRTLLLTALRKEVPVFGFSLGLVKAGALIGTVIDPETQGWDVAELTVNLMNQSDTSRSETTQGGKFEVALNMVVAERLNVSLPKTLVKRSKHVIKPETGR